MSDPTGRSGSSPPAMPTTMTWSKGPAARARRVACRASSGPIPVTSETTDHVPAVPVWVNTGSSEAGRRSNDFTIAFSSGCMGASTTIRLVRIVTPSSWRSVR